MRVLHAALSVSPRGGLIQQMEWEQAAATALKIPWAARIFLPEMATSPIAISAGIQGGNRLLRYLKLRLSYYQWLLSSAEEYDIVLLRHTPHDLIEQRFVKKLKSKIYSVHHTLEMPELDSEFSGIEGRLRAAFEKTIGASVLKHVAGIIGVTEEIVRFETERLADTNRHKRSFVYPNGIMCQSIDPPDLRGKEPEILFVASNFFSWHGLDLLIDALEGTTCGFTLHLVGKIPSELQHRCVRDPRIIMHGMLGAAAIASLSAKCWIGISSLALHRKKMSEACTLKVRQYLDSGLPVFAAHVDSALPRDFPYFLNGPVELSSMISFANRMREVSKVDVQGAAKPYISKEVLLWKLYSELMSGYKSEDRN